MAVTLLVRLRPNAWYLLLLLAAAAGAGYGAALGSVAGIVVAAAGAVLVILAGYPVAVSTVGRVPVLAVDGHGIRLPLMGVRLGWPEISSVTLGSGRGRGPAPVLLVFPHNPQAAISAARPWLRRELRTNLERHGTPIVVSGASLDHSVDDIAAAVRQCRPVSPA